LPGKIKKISIKTRDVILDIMDELLEILRKYTDINEWGLGGCPFQTSNDRFQAKEKAERGIRTNTDIPTIISFSFKFKTFEYQDLYLTKVSELINSLSNNFTRIPSYYNDRFKIKVNNPLKVLKQVYKKDFEAIDRKNKEDYEVFKCICDKHYKKLRKELNETFDIEIMDEDDMGQHLYHHRPERKIPDEYYDTIPQLSEISFICAKGDIIYDTLEKEGILNKYYPNWYKFGGY
jgi:hypothetical protein